MRIAKQSRKASKAKQHLTGTCPAGHSIYSAACDECRGLQDKWYARLESADFEDIESGGHLIDRKSMAELGRATDLSTGTTYEARVSYYQWCRGMVHHGRFDTARDKTIWEQHAEGSSRRKIADAIESEKAWVVRRVLKIQHSLVNQVIGSVSLIEGGVFRAI